jgi:type I restriction-modification system DNA methylase subunit
MAKAKKAQEGTTTNEGALGFEPMLWAAADALRNNMDAAEYKHVVLGLIFLKYISDAFEAKHAELEAQKKDGADPEDPDEYRAVETAKVIEEPIALATDVRAATQRGAKLSLSKDEVAFYDALETNDSAVKVLGEDTLKTIARELVAAVRKNVTIDWGVRENVRAHLRVIVTRILRKYGYPPDKQEKGTQFVLGQAEVLSEGWAVI